MSFRLDKISDTEYVLENGETGNSFQVPFEASRLYDRFGPPGAATYKIESEYNGPAGPIFDSLIPKLNLIYETFKPKKDQESFESKPAADEHDHGKTTYCQEYQKSIYKIRLKKDIELDFSFYNGRLRSITASRHGSYLLQDNLKKSLRTTLYEITVKCEQWPWPPGSKPRHIPHPVAVKVLKRLWKKHLQHRDKPSRRKTRCWYCNRRESSEESAAVFQMHKTLARGEKKYLRDTYVKKWATYQKMSVPVPRPGLLDVPLRRGRVDPAQLPSSRRRHLSLRDLRPLRGAPFRRGGGASHPGRHKTEKKMPGLPAHEGSE